MSALKYWIWLSTRKHVGSKTIQVLLENFETPEKVYFARDDEYGKIAGIANAEIKGLSDKNLTEAKKIIDSCMEKGYRIITINDVEYPSRLKNIYDPPAVIYVMGRLPLIDEEAVVSVVGTRNCTPYGLKAAERIGFEIAKAGGIVATGLARGIDTAAAKGARRAGGKVIGVLGCGLDIVYPPENKVLFHDVVSYGAIISEYPPRTAPNKVNFPVRNRIISGISLGVVVIEAPKRSGALITAERALEQSRDVFALPGNIDSDACEGSNELLKEGAMIITSGWDVIEEYRPLFPEKLGRTSEKEKILFYEETAENSALESVEYVKNSNVLTKKEIDIINSVEYIDLMKLAESLDDGEKAVVASMNATEMSADDIIDLCGLPATKVLSALTMLEIKGFVTRGKGKRFSLNLSSK